MLDDRPREAPSPTPLVPSLPAGSIDLPRAGSTVSRAVIDVRGWAVTTSGACACVELTVNGQSVGRARLGDMRRDVEIHMGMPAAAVSGFQHYVDLAELPELGEQAEIGGVGVALDGSRFALPPLRITVAQAIAQGELRHVDPRVRRGRSRSAGVHGELRLLVGTHELGYGGAQLFLAELLRRIAELGPVSGLVVSPREGPTRRVLEECGFDVHVTSPFPIGSLDEYEARLEELTAWAAQDHFDVALVNTMVAFPGADLASRLGLPTLWAIHESWRLPEYWATFEGAIDPEVQRRADELLRRATAAFTCEATRSCYESSANVLDCVTLPYGIDVGALDAWREEFDRPSARTVEGIAEDEMVLLCLGTIEPRKGQTQLIRAFAQVADRHPRTLLQLVGSREDHHAEVAREMVSLHGLDGRVRIAPVLPDVRACYATADVLVSASDVESTPRSILEAMALGLPVLSTGVFGVPELIADGRSGWLCEPRDVSALAAALDRVLSLDPAERSAVAVRARATVQADYRSEMCSRAWDRALRELAFSTQALRTSPARARSRSS